MNIYLMGSSAFTTILSSQNVSLGDSGANFQWMNGFPIFLTNSKYFSGYVLKRILLANIRSLKSNNICLMFSDVCKTCPPSPAIVTDSSKKRYCHTEDKIFVKMCHFFVPSALFAGAPHFLIFKDFCEEFGTKN